MATASLSVTPAGRSGSVVFTGLVETTGTVRDIRRRGDYRVLSIAAPSQGEPFDVGESVACDGACLTVVSSTEGSFVIEASGETASRTTLKDYRAGSVVNVERAVKAGGRLGGHLVSGHIDNVGVVDYLRPAGESLVLAVRFARRFDPLVIEKGSVAIDGVSLTIYDIRSGWLSVNIIPHTARVTTLGSLKVSDRANLEFDMIGKYVLKMINTQGAESLTMEKLRGSGW